MCERSTTSTDDDASYREFIKITASQSCNFRNRRKILFPRSKVKTLMRSTMLPDCLNAIAILHEHKTLTDRLNLTDIAKEFVCRNESRKCAFGNFY